MTCPVQARIIIPKSLLRITEASRHVVTVNVHGATKEQVTASVTVPSEIPTTRKIATSTAPMSEETLTAETKACGSAGRGRWAGPSPVKFYTHFLGSLYGDPFVSCASSRAVSRFT